MKAMTKGEVHEAVCAERYKNIDGKLMQLPEILRSIGNLKGLANKAIGISVGMSVISVLLTITLTLMKIVGAL